MTDEALYTVTELASQLGMTARAIRFYEDKGLISPGGRVPIVSSRCATAPAWF